MYSTNKLSSLFSSINNWDPTRLSELAKVMPVLHRRPWIPVWDRRFRIICLVLTTYTKRNSPLSWNPSPQSQSLGLITGLVSWLHFFLWHFFPSFPYHHHLLTDNPEKIVEMFPPKFASSVYCLPDICVCSKCGTNVWLKIMTQPENDCDKNVM